jgi:hypothetical protein
MITSGDIQCVVVEGCLAFRESNDLKVPYESIVLKLRSQNPENSK